jgi:hypothetical protein
MVAKVSYLVLALIVAQSYGQNASVPEAIVPDVGLKASPPPADAVDAGVGPAKTVIPKALASPAKAAEVIASMPSLDSLNMTSAAMEAAMTDLMLGKSAFAGTPMGGSINTIKKIVEETMMEKVKDAHALDQKELNDANTAIEQCASTKVSSIKKSEPMHAKYKVNIGLHKSCRNN